MKSKDKPLVWLHGEVKTPPFSDAARLEVGYLLRLLQKGESLSLPHSRPMPIIGSSCHELRIIDKVATWRLVYRVDQDAIIILEVFKKKTTQTPKQVIAICKKRLKDYINA
ncbi:MAG: type II toxin-antitoxin system RelE/ParE family toxin [Candidatus Marinimicrobia bacterium]|nr:type II toxin-antitoxin system RelE/ParE family toxin [Candidatus Neomarinimicrobiota bacterium]